MKETQPKTCEEYVLNQFFKQQEEIEQLKEENDKLTFMANASCHKLDGIVKLLKVATRPMSISEENNYVNIYVNGLIVGFYRKDDDSKDQSPYYALAKLIEMVNAIPEREQGE